MCSCISVKGCVHLLVFQYISPPIHDTQFEFKQKSIKNKKMLFAIQFRDKYASKLPECIWCLNSVRLVQQFQVWTWDCNLLFELYLLHDSIRFIFSTWMIILHPALVDRDKLGTISSWGRMGNASSFDITICSFSVYCHKDKLVCISKWYWS